MKRVSEVNVVTPSEVVAPSCEVDECVKVRVDVRADREGVVDIVRALNRWRDSRPTAIRASFDLLRCRLPSPSRNHPASCHRPPR